MSEIEKFNPEEEKKELEEFETTNPKKHNPNKFRYVVHAIGSQDQKASVAGFKFEGQLAGLDIGEYADPFVNPEKFEKRKVISASIIDQNHKGTWSDSGIILQIYKDNILSTHNYDAGTIHGQKQDIISFEELLQQTHPTTYNEIVISGKENPIKISGVFIRLDENGKPKGDQENYEKLMGLAYRLNLPIIKFEYVKEPDKDIEFKKNKLGSMNITFSKNGKIYSYTDRDDNGAKFFTNSGRPDTQCMTREEREEFLEELKNNLDNFPEDKFNIHKDELVKKISEDINNNKFVYKDKKEDINNNLLSQFYMGNNENISLNPFRNGDITLKKYSRKKKKR